MQRILGLLNQSNSLEHIVRLSNIQTKMTSMGSSQTNMRSLLQKHSGWNASRRFLRKMSSAHREH